MEIRETEFFARWFAALADKVAKAGNLGDVKPVGGGDKSTQDRDIRQAKQLAQNMRGNL